MKKIFTTIFLIVMTLSVIGVATVPQQAHAAGAVDIITYLVCANQPALCKGLDIAGSMIFISIAAGIGNMVLWISSWFLSVAGIILNISIALTMNIKALYEATPAIDKMWVVIRNLSSIFIIFGLLYMSIATILDLKKADVKGLVVKIVMAGLLINFSLFFTKVAIDTSNLISLQFYRAIVPNSQNAQFDKDGITKLITSSFDSGGLSNVFMDNLKITKIYNNGVNKSGLLLDAKGGAAFKIAVSTIAGSILMILAALSFFAAAIAFIVRLVVLLLLMAFSPIYFVGMIFPTIEQKVSKKWEGWLVAELTFMPVYLLLMYVALSFISTMDPGDKSKGFFAAIDIATSNGSAAVASASGENIMLYMIGIILQYTIAFILILIPLFAALQMGGISAQWGNTAKKWVGGMISKNIGGRVASKVAESDRLKSFASKSVLGELALKGIRGGAQNYNKQLSSQVKARTEFAESLGEHPRLAVLKAQLGGKRAELKVAKDTKNATAVKRIDAEIEKLKGEADLLENKRKQAYSNRIGKRALGVFGSKDTLWFKVARKDKEAAAEIQKKIKKDEVDSTKKKIEEDKPDLKRLEAKDRASTKSGGTGDDLSTDETAYLKELRDNLKKHQTKIMKLETEIAEL